MSYIVPSERPRTCGVCPFARLSQINYGKCWCALDSTNTRSYANSFEKLDNCPLIELPPHGRLIDADKFAETLKEVSIRQGYDKLFSDNILSVGDVFDAIAADLKGEGLDEYKLAPTIIEAEGET